MIISARHRFIFVAIPKTGTHSVRRALRPCLGAEDQEQVGLFVQSRLRIPQLARLGHGHISLHELQPFIKREEFEAAFKFAFVRNPFDRFVSYCSFKARSGDVFKRDPRRVMRHYLAQPPHEQVLFKPQASFITSPAGDLLTDYVGRVETMQDSFDFIASKIGIPAVQLDKVNASRPGGYRDYYDQQLIDGVAKLYARDLELFGYDY